MKPWEVYYWQPPEWDKPHPAVIVSHPDRADRRSPVEVVICSTQRAARDPEKHEVRPDQADGMDWPTLCKCDVIFAVPRTQLKNRKGEVSRERRGQIVRRIMDAHDWSSVL